MIGPRTALLVAVLLAAAGPASATALEMKCRLIDVPAASAPAAPDWGRSFSVSVPFGDGQGLALVDPDSQAILRMLYAADVAVGQFVTPAEEAPITWTRASSVRARLLGQVIRSDGNLITLAIDRLPENGLDRGARVFDSASGLAWTGACAAKG